MRAHLFALLLALAAPIPANAATLFEQLGGAEGLTRITNALVLMALVAATIQQAHGLVEMHFGVFVILALLLYYRDWLPVVVAAGAIAVHHLAFYWLQSRGLPVQGADLEVVGRRLDAPPQPRHPFGQERRLDHVLDPRLH